METATPFEMALFEEDLSMLDEMDALLANVEQETGSTGERIVDELLIRKMIIKKKFMEKEKDRLKQLRDAIKAEWDRKIAKIDTDASKMDGIILHFLEKTGDKLQLDVATVSLRKVKHKVQISNEEDLKELLINAGMLNQFLDEPKFNTTAARNYYIDQLDNAIATIQENAKSNIKAMEAEYKERTKEMKAAEKKIEKEKFEQAKKDVKAGTDRTVKETIDSFKQVLPESLEYEPESKSLSIRMNY
jgi:hypothetical protein